jgi:hypothetical protein
MYYDPVGQNQQVKMYPDEITTPSGGAGGGTGDYDFSDFASSSENQSSSYGGPSPWAKEWTQAYLNKIPDWNRTYAIQGMESANKSESAIGSLDAKQIQDLLANLFNTRSNTEKSGNQMSTGIANDTSSMRDEIERIRQLLPKQYAEEMNLYNQRATQPVLNRMSGRGILNSSVTGGALSDVLRDTQAKQSDLVTQSDIWAGNQNLDLSKYITGKNFDINQWMADKGYETDKYQTDKQYASNETTGERQLANEKEKRANYLTSEMAYANLLPSLINALREQESQSTGSSFGGLMDFFMASQGG